MESRKQSILIVDDVVSNIEILSQVVGSAYEILFATNGEDALRIASEQNPDLILLDVMMPGMDGYEVCSRLKSDDRTREIPVIFVTGLDQDTDESRGLEVGGIDYVTKPVRASIVRARVRNHLELKRYRDLLKATSASDGLTGIANRRKFDEALDGEWRRASLARTPLTLVLMDVDFFKAYNDHYGHPAGDECLKQIGKCLAGVARRPGDLVARYGGDEFAMLLPNTDLGGAVHLAERVRQEVARLNLPHAGGIDGRATLSIGVAALTPSEGSVPLDLLKLADEALYVAKQRGRNQVASGLAAPV